MSHRVSCLLLTLTVTAVLAQRSFAQAPINSNVALQPSTGGVIIRQQVRYFEADDDPTPANSEIKGVIALTTIVYGLRDDVTLLFTAPVVFREVQFGSTGRTDHQSGVADLTALAKIRLYRDDFGPTDTSRFDLLGGLEIRSGDSHFTSDSYDPIIGGVFTYVKGRHAFDVDSLWKFNTGSGIHADDRMDYDLAYLYRLWPRDFTAGGLTSVYAVLELNGQYETNGDHELFISPGIQFVTQRWIAELGVQVPIVQELAHRPETDFVVVASFRVQF